MGMVVRTNTMAINAYRQLGMNNSAVAKSLEKLASGYRINRAGDDAAGLAISEKMKAQITGLETASANAQDGISLIQTAEGNLSEVHDMLNRMVELATKSANGTYTSTERQALQDEADQLLEEIDRISKSANFNGTKLLDGTMGLNNDALKVGETTDETVAMAGLPANNETDKAKLHLNTDGQAQQGGKFTIDLADCKVDLSAVTDAEATIKFGINGKQAQVTLDLTGADNKKVWSGAELVNKLYTDGRWIDAAKSPDATGAVKYAAINKALYKVEKDGTKLTFSYAGATTGTPGDDNSGALPTDPITDEMMEVDQKANKTVTVNVFTGAKDATAAGGTDKTDDLVSGSSYHGVLDITPMQKEISGQRAGIQLDLAANATELFKDGSKLTIDGTTFTFKMTADAKVTGDNIIDLSKVKGAGATPTNEEYAKAAAMQLSNYSTDHFEIGDGGSGIIKVDQTVEDYAGGNNAPYTTYDSLTKLFSLSKASTETKASLTLMDNALLSDKESILVDGNKVEFAKGADAAATLNNLKSALGDKYDATVNDNVITIKAKSGSGSVPKLTGSGLTLQIGDTADEFNKMNVQVDDMSAKGLGLEALKKSGIMTEVGASKAIDTIKNAINTVSSTRAGMGALQNRLEHTINNLDVAAENLSAANSRIRDTDMAKEMMNYTKMNVLVQSAQAMLAQANQQPQSVLQLLQ